MQREETVTMQSDSLFLGQDGTQEQQQRPLTWSVNSSHPAIAITHYPAGMTPSPQSPGESCFCRLDLFRRCVVGDAAELQHGANLIQTPSGTGAVAMTPLHYSGGDDDDDDEHDVPATPTAKSLFMSPAAVATNSQRSATPAAAALRALHKSQEERWEELEDDLLIRLNGRLDHLHLFRQLHNDGIQNAFLLQSIAYLSTTRRKSTEEATYYEHISAVAAFLGVGRAKREQKLAVVGTLMACLSPPEASWQVRDEVVEGTLDFIICRSNQDWEFMDHSETMLIWELRAMALRLLDREQERVDRVAKTGNTAAIVISAGALLVEEGMARSGSAISSKIEHAGSKVKEHLQPNEYPLIMDRDAVVALAFSDAAKRASLGAKEGTKMAMDGLRDVSSRGFQMMASTFEDGKIAESIPPEGREALKAAGKVGLATIGAAAIVGDALLETSRAVMEKTAVVTADIVHHKYGAAAGRVANDAGETAANIFRTLGNVNAVSEGTAIARTVAHNVGKEQASLEAEKAKEALRALESQATNLFRTAIANGGNFGFGRLAAAPSQTSLLPTPQQALKENVQPAATSSVSVPIDQVVLPRGKIPELATCSSMDSESASSLTTVPRLTSSDEESSMRVSNHSKSVSSTSATFATRRSVESRGMHTAVATPSRRRVSHRRPSTASRRGSAKRVPLTPA